MNNATFLGRSLAICLLVVFGSSMAQAQLTPVPIVMEDNATFGISPDTLDQITSISGNILSHGTGVGIEADDNGPTASDDYYWYNGAALFRAGAVLSDGATVASVNSAESARAINAAGTLVYEALCSNAVGTSEDYLMAGATIIMTEGSTATHDGNDLSFFSDASIDDAGNIYVEVDTTGSASDEAVYMFTGPFTGAPVSLGPGAGTLTEFTAITGGAFAGLMWDDFSAFNDPCCNAGGDLLVEGELDDHTEHLLLVTPGVGYTVLLSEDTTVIAGPVSSGDLNFIDIHSLADNGDWCAEVDIDGGTTTSSNDSILVGEIGASGLIVIAQEGMDMSALFPGPVTLGSINTFDMSETGTVLYTAAISGPGSGAGIEAVFLYDHGTLSHSLLFVDESPLVLVGPGSVAADIDFVDPRVTSAGDLIVQLSDANFDDLLAALVDLPPNDCILQKTISDGTTAYDTTGATASVGTGGATALGLDHFYCYTASCLGIVTISTDNAGHSVAAYDGCDCPQDGANELGTGASVSFPAVPGNTYLIAVGGAVGGPGNLTIDCSPFPAINNDCALSLAGPGFGNGSYGFSTVGASLADPAIGCSPGLGGSVWFKWEAPCSGEMIASLCGSGYDTNIAVYPGTACPTSSAEEIACDDDGCPGGTFRSIVSTAVTAGDLYLIQISGWNGNEGIGTLDITCQLPVRLNEVRNDATLPSTSVTEQEYIEVVGPIGYDLSTLHIITVGDAFTPMSGGLDDVTPLTGSIGTSGFYLVADSSTFAYDLTATADQFESLNFENADAVTHLLVAGWTGPATASSSFDLDFDNDGVFDTPEPWSILVDSIALDQPTTTTTAELFYGPNVVQAVGAYRCVDLTGAWIGHSAAVGADSPGASNAAAAPDSSTAPGVIGIGATQFCTLGATTDGLDLDPAVCDLMFGTQTIHNDIWWLFDVACTGEYNLSTCNDADFDTRLAVYLGTVDDPAAVVGCNDDGVGCAGFTSDLTLTLTEGNTYLVRLGGFSASQLGLGTLSISATLPFDDCTTAGVMTEGLNPFDTTCTTTDGPVVANCATQFVGGNDFVFRAAYYTYTPAVDGSVLMAACEESVDDPATGSATYDTRLTVYSDASCPIDPATAIACDDDEFGDVLGNVCTGFTSALVVNAVTGGQTYLIEVGGFSATAFGAGTLAITLSPFCTPITLDDLSADMTAGDAPLTVNFTTMTSGDPGTFAWDFGDGGMSTDTDMTSYTFNTPGTWVVNLTVTNACGTDSGSITITVCDPVVASFDVDEDTGIATHCANFTSTSTGDIISELWDLDGDMAPDASGGSASFMYTTPGVYTATLSLTGQCGGADSASAMITVLGMGDCNGDGTFDIADPVALALYLFGGGGVPACPNACDTNGDGSNDLGDVVYSLVTLFSAGPAPVAAPDCTLCN